MVTKYIGWLSADSDYVCDGVSDHVQINQALAWAAANPGNIIYIRGPYTYDIGAQILIGSSTVFNGDSTAVLRLNNSCMWASMVPVIGQLGGTGTHTTGVEICGFSIDCNESHLYHDGVGSPERVHGQGYFNCIHIQGSSTNHAADIHIHDLTLHDSMGDGPRIVYADNVRVHDCTMYNLQHSSIFLIEVVGGDVYNNTIQHITNAGIRLDHCQSINIYNNDLSDWTGTTNAPTKGANAIQIGNQPSGHTRLTNNIRVYDNTIQAGGSGIVLMDALGTAGTTQQVVTIFNNTIDDCGETTWAAYFAGVTVWSWGNGLTLENNTISNNHHAGLLIYNSISSGMKATVRNNNITGTLVRSGSTLSGYGMCNRVPTSFSVIAENNYSAGNATGNYYQIVPLSESTTAISDTLPGGETTDDDIHTDDPDIPAARLYQLDEDYYIAGRSGYINGKPFKWFEKKVDCSKSLGQDKCPGVAGYTLTDFGLGGAELTLDCFGPSISEMHSALAAFNEPGRITIELGGDFSTWLASGVAGNYSTDLRLGTSIPTRYHPYSILLVMDKPYYEGTTERMRSRYIYNSMLFSSDDCFKGNYVKNSSFEDWTPSLEWGWETQTNIADVAYEDLDWSKELKQFVAVASSGTDNRVAISNGSSWRLPTGLSCANKNNDWKGVRWGATTGWTSTGTPEGSYLYSADGYRLCDSLGNPLLSSDVVPPEVLQAGRWVAVGHTSGTDGAMYSEDSDAWVAGVTPTGDLEDVCYVRDDSASKYRYVACGAGIIIYSDDGAETWSQVSVTGSLKSIDYSPTLKKIVAVASSGEIIYSSDYGATWSSDVAPASQAWNDVVWADFLSMFVAVSTDGSKQIATSPTGVTWTLRDTPYTGVNVTPGGGDISSATFTTQTGFYYTSASTVYTTENTSLEYTATLPALTGGNIYRITQVSAKLRTLRAGKIASMKVTVQVGSGTETQIDEWTNNTTSYVQKVKDVAIETTTGNTVTIRYYLKTSDPLYRAASTELGYHYTIASTSGGSVSYTYNEWTGLAVSNEINAIIAVAQTGSDNRFMYSLDALSWILGESADDNNWQSVKYSPELNQFAAIASSGTGTRVMISDSYGGITNPDGWEATSTGQTRASDTAINGIYSLQITGDGTTVDKGTETQKLIFESGTRYVLSAYGKVSGMTAGSLRVDILSGQSVVKEIVWSADCDWTQKQISFKFEVAPSDSYIRVRGYNLNNGATVYCDKIVVQKSSDFELSSVGADIATYGTVDATPDVIITGVGQNPDSTTAGKTVNYVSEQGFSYSSAATAYSTANTSLEYTAVLPALSSSGAYRIDKVFGDLKTAHAGTIAYLKVTIKTNSLNGGVEYSIAEWIDTTGSYTPKSRDLNLVCGAGESVTLRYYMKTSNASYRAYATNIGYTYTEMGVGGSVTTNNLYLYNNADTSTVLSCCDVLYPNYTMEINEDDTGSLSYAEDFQDNNCVYTAYSMSSASYNEDNKTLFIDYGGAVVFPMPCKYPVASTPFTTLFVVNGTPKISIANDLNGAPSTWYEIDGNQSSTITDAEAYRLLENENLPLNSKTKWYVKIAPAANQTLEISSLYIYAGLSTVDAERFKIFAGTGANVIGAYTTGHSSCVVTLRYRDLDLAV